MSESTDERHVVVTKANADDDDYTRAVVHPTEESANEYLAEVKASAPWQSHSVVAFSDGEWDSATPADEVSDPAVVTTEKGDES